MTTESSYQLPVTLAEMVERRWIFEAGFLPGVGKGSEIVLAVSNGSLEMSGFNGRLASMTLRDTTFDREPNGWIRVRNRPDSYNIALSPGELGMDPTGRLVRDDPVVQSLARASSNWTAPAVLRQYKDDPVGRASFANEVVIFGLQGYTPTTQSADGGHVHVGRLLLTGGLSVFAGKSGIRSDGVINVTFQRSIATVTPPPASTKTDSAKSDALEMLNVLERMGQLRDAGVLSQEEFETKKAELLARM